LLRKGEAVYGVWCPRQIGLDRDECKCPRDFWRGGERWFLLWVLEELPGPHPHSTSLVIGFGSTFWNAYLSLMQHKVSMEIEDADGLGCAAAEL
jgi:hypothetical protein